MAKLMIEVSVAALEEAKRRLGVPVACLTYNSKTKCAGDGCPNLDACHHFRALARLSNGVVSFTLPDGDYPQLEVSEPMRRLMETE